MDDHRAIYGTCAPETAACKDVKVRLPVRHLIRLHGLKLLKSQNISDTVTEALARYFAEQEKERASDHGSG